MKKQERGKEKEMYICVKYFQTEGSANAKAVSEYMPGYSKTMRGQCSSRNKG